MRFVYLRNEVVNICHIRSKFNIYFFFVTPWVYISPASNRIFQSLLLKFVLMRFQKMSAPCDRERAWRSWGTAREASWQNSDFNMDHKLKCKHRIRHTHTLLSQSWLNATISTKTITRHAPRDEHLFLDVSQKLGVILAGEVQTLSMETQDLQTVQHVEQDVRLLKLGHFLNTNETCDSACTTCKLK